MEIRYSLGIIYFNLFINLQSRDDKIWNDYFEEIFHYWYNKKFVVVVVVVSEDSIESQRYNLKATANGRRNN